MTRGQEKLAVLAILLLGLMLLGTECEEEIGTIKITPSSVTLAVGATQQFKSEGLDRMGERISESDISWASSDSDVGTITSSGLFTAAGNGTCKVTASYGTGLITATATVEVTQTLKLIEIEPSSAMVYQDKTLEFTAEGKDTYNNSLTTFDPAPSWSLTSTGTGTRGDISVNTTDNMKCTFSASGTEGGGSIVATWSSVTGTASITVKQVLASIAIAADGYDIGQALYTIADAPAITITATGYDLRGEAMDVTPIWTVTTAGGVIGGIAPTSNPAQATFNAGPSTASGSITATEDVWTNSVTAGTDATASINVFIGTSP